MQFSQHLINRSWLVALGVGLIVLLLGASMALAATTPQPAMQGVAQLGGTTTLKVTVTEPPPSTAAPTATPTASPTASATSTPSPTAVNREEIESYTEDYRTIVSELQEKEIIPQGGSLVYQTGYAFFDGIGNWYEPLAPALGHTNFIMAGELELRRGDTDEVEACMLGGRVEPADQHGIIDDFLVVGFDSAGNVFFENVARYSRGDSYGVRARLDIEEPHHFLIIAIFEELAIYVDGRLALLYEDLSVFQKGSWGIMLLGEGYGARCSARNLWIYELDLVWDGEEGYCGVTTDRVINLREGPGTTFPVARQPRSNSVLDVAGQIDGQDGFIWWQLTDGNWVRSDVVRELGNCEEEAPVVEFEEE